MKFYPQIAQNKFTSVIGFCKYERAFDYFFFINETWFSLDGYINSQNYRVWPRDNPSINADKSLHAPKIEVWYAVSPQRVIELIVFELVINSDVYCDIISSFHYWSQMNRI